MAEKSDITIEVTRPEELSRIVGLIAAVKEDEPVPPKLGELIGVVGKDVGATELGARAEKDAGLAALLREVTRESINGNHNTVVRGSWFTRIKNDWSRKKKTTFVFLFVVISVGGPSLLMLAPDRGTADQGVGAEKNIAVTLPSASAGRPEVPPGNSAPALPPPVLPPRNLSPNVGPNLPPAGDPAPPGPGNPVPAPPPPPPAQLQTTVSQARGLPGTSVNFYGTGYQDCPDRGHRTVNILWDGVITGEAVPIEADGRFGMRFTVPENASVGEHHLYGQCTDDTGLWARATYTVTPPLVVTASPSKLRAGQVLSVRGTNFDGCPDYGDRTVNVHIDAMGLTTRVPIRSDGTIAAQFTIPQGTAPNDYAVTGQCRDGGQWARGIFTVQP